MVKIKSFSQSDTENLFVFLREALGYMGYDFLPESKDSDLENIDQVYMARKGAFLLLKSEGKIIGCIGVSPNCNDYAELKRFYIKRNFHGKGYGKQLIQAAISLAIKNEFSYLRLDTTFKSVSAIHLFKSTGFIEVQRYNYDPYAELFMELEL